MRSIDGLFTFLITIVIRGYQNLVSPFMFPCCRYHPSCSSFALRAFKIHGLLKGLILTLNRLLRCNPWGSYGYDPVPKTFFLISKKNINN